MGTPVVLTKSAILTRLRTNLEEGVHSAEPVRYTLPYVNFVTSYIAERVQINKTSELWRIDTVLDIVSDAQSETMKTADTLATEVDEALETALTLTGYTVKQQFTNQLESQRGADDSGAELEIARLTFRMEVV